MCEAVWFIFSTDLLMFWFCLVSKHCLISINPFIQFLYVIISKSTDLHRGFDGGGLT